MTERILCVDDDVNLLAGLQRNLRKQFELQTVVGAAEALAAMDAHGPFAVALVDLNLPEMNGVELLKRVRVKSPDTVCVMLTGNTDQQTAIDAVNHGHIFQFLTKPCPIENLAAALNNALRQHRLVTAERELLEKTLNGAVKAISDILALADPQSFGRGEALRHYIQHFAQHFAYPHLWELEVAAMLSQLGYVSVPGSVSRKARAEQILSNDERDMLLRVPEISAHVVENIPRLENVSRIVRYQLKHYDGMGAPEDGVKGTDIPLGARILKVLADLVHFESKRVTRHEALERMRERIGWYDPDVLTAAYTAFCVSPPQAAPVPQRRRAIRASALRAGQVLLSDVTTNEGMLLVRAQTTVTPLLIQRLKNFAVMAGLKEPLFIDDSSEAATTY